MAIETLNHNIQNNEIVNILTDRDTLFSVGCYSIRTLSAAKQRIGFNLLAYLVDAIYSLLGRPLVFPCHFDLMSDDSLCFEN